MYRAMPAFAGQGRSEERYQWLVVVARECHESEGGHLPTTGAGKHPCTQSAPRLPKGWPPAKHRVGEPSLHPVHRTAQYQTQRRERKERGNKQDGNNEHDKKTKAPKRNNNKTKTTKKEQGNGKERRKKAGRPWASRPSREGKLWSKCRSACQPTRS